MIAIALIIGLSALALAGIGLYWKKIAEWIKKAASKVEEVLHVAVEGVRTFVQKTADGLKNISKHYNQNKVTHEWEEHVFNKLVSENDIPEEILMKLNGCSMNEEISTTKEFAQALALANA